MPDDVTDRVRAALTDYAAPALELDGSALEVLDVTAGVVRLRLNGACAGCPSTLMTLVMGLEQELRRLVPEVEYLEAVP
jgi:Fe-S cluster biogenesis protein NfuA